MTTVERTTEQLALATIRLDGGTQSRTALSQDKIDEYAQHMLDGAIFPAIIVFYDGADYWLADGFHRYHAANQSSAFLSIEIKQGTRREAVLYSMEANTRHGIPLSLEDRKRCAGTILSDEEWSRMSDREIGRRCGLNHETVGVIRHEIYGENRQKPTNPPVEPVEAMEEARIRTPELDTKKREHVKKAIAENPEDSNRKIAKELGYSEGLVRDARKALQEAERQRPLSAPKVEPVPVSCEEEWAGPTEETAIVTEPRQEEAEDEPEEEYELTEEDRYFLAIDTGTLDYYHDDLRREAIRRDEEQREMAPTTTENTARRNVDNIPVAVPHISSKNNEWYTPEKYIQAAREVMGGIDLDPASCAQANETVKAARYYDIQSNGLDKEWAGCVWLNPPYGRSEDGSNQDVWSSRLIDQYHDGVTAEAILLVNAAVDTKWFQRLFNYPICFPAQRINFSTPELTISGSTHGSALVYFGPKEKQFVEVFSRFGAVVRRWQ